MIAFTEAQASKIAADVFNVVGKASRLRGEHDQNFCIQSPAGQKFVLKVSGLDPDKAHIRFQHRILEKLNVAGSSLSTPQPLSTPAGDALGTHSGCPGRKVQCLSWIKGTPYGECGERSAELNQKIGRSCGHLTLSLRSVAKPSGLDTHAWDLRQASNYIAYTRHITDDTLRSLAENALRAFQTALMPATVKLPRSVIHGDLNDTNVLVSETGAGAEISFIDFGDAVYSTTLFELAIACAYGCLNQSQPELAVQQIVKGYEEKLRLGSAEKALLPGLIRTRLAMSLAIAAERENRAPGNTYWQASVAPATEALRALSGNA